MSVIERHLAGALVSVPLKTPRSRQVGIPEAGYHPQFPIIPFHRPYPVRVGITSGLPAIEEQSGHRHLHDVECGDADSAHVHRPAALCLL
jgi:hypothetical protein